MFAGNFAPRSWALCDGQLLAISQNEALFSLLGTTYGGDGRTTFGLPDLRGRIPIHEGTGPGLSPRNLGAKSGQEKVTLTANQLASHNHPLKASTDAGGESSPAGNVTGESPSLDIYAEENPTVALSPAAIAGVGGSQSHNNIQPFLCVNFIIALVGIFPS
jgi:microcystin-dependent protein